MANDRIFLACPSCGEVVLLWKHYPSRNFLAGYTPEAVTSERLDKFFDNHLECVEKRWAISLDEDCGLKLWTEQAHAEWQNTNRIKQK